MQIRKAIPRFVSLVVLFSLCGCGKFFPDIHCRTNCNNSGGNYLFVGNANTENIAGYTISSSALNTISGSPFSLGVPPALWPSRRLTVTSTRPRSPEESTATPSAATVLSP